MSSISFSILLNPGNLCVQCFIWGESKGDASLKPSTVCACTGSIRQWKLLENRSPRFGREVIVCELISCWNCSRSECFRSMGCPFDWDRLSLKQLYEGTRTVISKKAKQSREVNWCHDNHRTGFEREHVHKHSNWARAVLLSGPTRPRIKRKLT